MSDTIKSIIPANDWYFVHRNAMGDDHVQPLAAFGLQEDGSVVGLVPVGTRETNGGITPPRIVPVPSISSGRFIHRNDLNDKQRAIAKLPA